MTDTTVDVWNMTPDQATAALDEMATAFKASQGEPTPQQQLDEKFADPKFRAKLDAGSTVARTEFDQLVTAAAASDPVKAAMTNSLPEIPDSSLLQMATAAGWLRDLGLSENVVEETLSGKAARPKEVALAKQWRADHEADPEWVKRLLAGGDKEKRELALANIIIVNAERVA